MDGIPSPSPDFPQQIKNVTGNANIKIQNKNLFTGDYSQFNSAGGVGTLYDYFKLPENDKVYTISVIAKNDFAPTRTTYLGFSGNGGDANLGTRWVIAGTSTPAITKGTKISINNIDNEKKLTYISMYSKGDTNLKNFTDNFEIQLEQGATATSYVPHQEQNYPFTFSEGQRGMQGTTLEDDGIHNERKQIVLDGTENWQYYQNNIFYCILNIPNIIRNTIAVNCLSDNYIAVNSSSSASDFETLSTNYNYSINTHTTQNLIRIKDKRFTNVADLKTALTLKPVTVEYKLANEEKILYNETQQAQYNAIKNAKSYDEQTNISQTNDELPFILDIEALKWKTNNEVNLLNSNNKKTAEYLETSLEPEEVEKIEEVEEPKEVEIQEEERVDTEENTENTAEETTENAENSAESEEE